MNSIRIATTPLLGLRALGTSGSRSYQRLFEVLSARLGLEHAGLLAEPVPTPDGSQISWYIAGREHGVAIGTLPEAAQAQVRERLENIIADINELARRAMEEGQSGADLSAALQQAVTVPGPDYIYAVPLPDSLGGPKLYRPVLVAWSHSTDGEPGYKGGLEGRARSVKSIKPITPQPSVKPPPPPPPMTEGAAIPVLVESRAPRNWSWLLYWLLWFLFALIVLRIFWMLLWGCGLTIFGLNFCGAPGGVGQTSALIDVVTNLEGQLARRPICEAGAPALTPDQVNRRVSEAGGTKGRLDFMLNWSTLADLDLAVICPSGETIEESTARNRMICGAKLDVDANSVNERASWRTSPVEHIVWPLEAAAPPSGKFRVRVRYFGDNGDTTDPVPFQVIVTDGDRAPRVFSGTVPRRQSAAFPEVYYDYDR